MTLTAAVAQTLAQRPERKISGLGNKTAESVVQTEHPLFYDKYSLGSHVPAILQ